MNRRDKMHREISSSTDAQMITLMGVILAFSIFALASLGTEIADLDLLTIGF